ncbi:MAG TPA: hypothetical protein VFE34_10250 [Dongiaceae bacterium]|jgi:hypothetical protein|nr:hypothetical protein [Dongiaceae bacterium]
MDTSLGRAKLLPALLTGSMLAGCSMLPYGPQVKAVADQAAVTAIEDRKAFNDKKLTVSVAAVCDNSLGAVLRLEDDQMRNSLFTLCGGDGQAVTMDRLADLVRTLDQLRAAGS